MPPDVACVAITLMQHPLFLLYMDNSKQTKSISDHMVPDSWLICDSDLLGFSLTIEWTLERWNTTKGNFVLWENIFFSMQHMKQ